MLPEGHRLHVVLEGITRGFAAVNIRKFVVRAARLARPGRARQPDPAGGARSSRRRCCAGLNIVVAGGTQAGKTTMLNCLAAAIPGGERVISARRSSSSLPPSRLGGDADPAGGLEGTGEIALRDLVKESLRMRPSRMIVGEVRAEECLDLLLALNAGLPGMASLHANSAREALVKMCTLPLLAGENISARFVVPTVAASVDLVVHLGIGADGVRRVDEIVGGPGPRGERRHRDRADLRPRAGPAGSGRPGCPPHVERFERVGIDVRGLLTGRA